VTRFRCSRTLAIAVAVSCGSASLVPWGSEVAASPVAETSDQSTWRPVTSGPLARSMTATGTDPLAVVAAAAYRALVLAESLGSGTEPVGFGTVRRQVVDAVAERTGLDPEVLEQRWVQAGAARQLALFAGLSQVGVPYKRFASRPGVGFDCSGLTAFAWGLVGEELPRSSRAQVRASERVEADDAQPGDLAYYPGHVMMSLGVPGAVLHSPEPGRDVEVRVVSERRARRWVYADPLA